MLRPVSTSTASANVAPVAVRGASAAAEVATGQARAAASSSEVSNSQAQSAPEPSAIFRYNSFEFVYRQDIGKIILVGQSPETGERVVQVPSEQALRAYERTARAEKVLNKPANSATAPTGQSPQTSQGPAPTPQPTPQLAQTLAAVVGGSGGFGGGSGGFVSLSA